MSAEIVFLLEPDNGRVTVESSKAPHWSVQALKKDLGESESVNCGRPTFSSRQYPIKVDDGPDNKTSFASETSSIHLYRLYHSSIVDGPGRRSVIQVSGCSIRCPGCYVPETHELQSGTLTSIAAIVDELESRRSEHDGVTILGGEPFDQPGALSHLVTTLKERDFHVTVYTGYTVENLRSKCDQSVDRILDAADLLIDGPYIREQGSGSGEYRGSSNQRILPSPKHFR